MDLREMLPSEAHRAMLAILEQWHRGRMRAITTDSLRAEMHRVYRVSVTDRDMRAIRRDLVRYDFPCFPCSAGYYFAIEAADLHDAKAYHRKKVMPMLKERGQMGRAFEASKQRDDNALKVQGSFDFVQLDRIVYNPVR